MKILDKKLSDTHILCLVIAIEPKKVRGISFLTNFIHNALLLFTGKSFVCVFNEAPGIQDINHKPNLLWIIDMVVKKPGHLPGKTPKVAPINSFLNELDRFQFMLSIFRIPILLNLIFHNLAEHPNHQLITVVKAKAF